VTRNIGIYIAYRYTLQHEKITSVNASGNAPDEIMIFISEIQNQTYLRHDNGITIGFRFYL